MTSRPLVIQSARDDHLAGRRGLANVLAPMDELRVAYELSDAVERLYHHIVPGGTTLRRTVPCRQSKVSLLRNGIIRAVFVEGIFLYLNAYIPDIGVP